MSGSVGTLGKYQIIREIARSNDIVYEAYDPIMNRRVALKELAMPSASTDAQRQERKDRFLREARAAGTLTHPNIVTVYEYGEDAGRHFIAMEFLEGHTLRNEIDTKGFLPHDRCLDIAMDVLDALDYAHNHGVIHRDIKPDNIQLLPDGRVKLTDFGIARLTFEPNITMDGQVFGTPSYMSPEQVVGKEIDARSDVFSLAVVLYEMLAGKKPFMGDSVVAITYAIMNHAPEKPAQANWAVWQVLEQCLDKSPQLRPSSAREMRRMLEDAQRASESVVIDPRTAAPPPLPYPTGSYGPGAFGSNTAPVNPYAPIPPGQGPPGSYTYNPYQPGVPPPAGGQQPYGFMPPPIYYPPAPRQPLLKAETRQFLGKLFLSFVVLGTVFGLLLVGIGAISTVIDRETKQRQDKQVMATLQQLPESMPLEERIQRYKSAKLIDPVMRRVHAANIAALLVKQADALQRGHDMVGAERALLDAAGFDDDNPQILSKLGEFYGRMAQREPDAMQRPKFWEESAQYWLRAASLERDPARHRAYLTGACQAYIQLGLELRNQSEFDLARQALYRARELAESGSSEAAIVEQALDAMR